MGSTRDEVGGGCHRYSAAELGMQLRGWPWRGKVLQVTYLLPWQVWPVRSQRVSAGDGAERNQQVGKGSSDGKIYVVHWRCKQEGKGGCNRCSDAELG